MDGIWRTNNFALGQSGPRTDNGLFLRISRWGRGAGRGGCSSLGLTTLAAHLLSSPGTLQREGKRFGLSGNFQEISYNHSITFSTIIPILTFPVLLSMFDFPSCPLNLLYYCPSIFIFIFFS